MAVNVLFKFNFTANHYDYDSTKLSCSFLYKANSPITYLSISNDLLMMQSNSTGDTFIYNINSNSMASVSGLPLAQTFNFFFIFNAFYILQSTGLVRLSFNSSTNAMTLNTLVTQLPYNTYRLNFETSMDPFFIPGRPYLYKGGICVDSNSKEEENSCISYNCTVANCSSCPIFPTTCSSCVSGMILIGNAC